MKFKELRNGDWFNFPIAKNIIYVKAENIKAYVISTKCPDIINRRGVVIADDADVDFVSQFIRTMKDDEDVHDMGLFDVYPAHNFAKSMQFTELDIGDLFYDKTGTVFMRTSLTQALYIPTEGDIDVQEPFMCGVPKSNCEITKMNLTLMLFPEK